eukprot:scaffold2752_cov393-Prasinococcus_capsulatus_cf.AAC.33
MADQSLSERSSDTSDRENTAGEETPERHTAAHIRTVKSLREEHIKRGITVCHDSNHAKGSDVRTTSLTIRPLPRLQAACSPSPLRQHQLRRHQHRGQLPSQRLAGSAFGALGTFPTLAAMLFVSPQLEPATR